MELYCCIILMDTSLYLKLFFEHFRTAQWTQNILRSYFMRCFFQFFFSLLIKFIVKVLISSIFDECSILLQTKSRLNHISYRNFHFQQVANALRDNIGSKKQPLTSEKNEPGFLFRYQKFRVRINHTIKHNQTQ